jgi:hypothetical protein
MELHLDRELLGATQPRSWDPVFEEATLCVGRQSSQDGIGVMAETKSHRS